MKALLLLAFKIALASTIEGLKIALSINLLHFKVGPPQLKK
jgi:hypothetical protein